MTDLILKFKIENQDYTHVNVVMKITRILRHELLFLSYTVNPHLSGHLCSKTCVWISE